ncbi:hypothetical protein JHK87_039568 [Glycine soja]|nr:hypothetical protein JHK87_039568 [Glycine soja]
MQASTLKIETLMRDQAKVSITTHPFPTCDKCEVVHGSKRIPRRRKFFFQKVAEYVLTEKDQTSRKDEVPTYGNLVANKEGEKEVLTPPEVGVPFPQRLKDKSKDGQFGRFVEMLKRVHLNIPFIEAIAQTP